MNHRRIFFPGFILDSLTFLFCLHLSALVSLFVIYVEPWYCLSEMLHDLLYGCWYLCIVMFRFSYTRATISP